MATTAHVNCSLYFLSTQTAAAGYIKHMTVPLWFVSHASSQALEMAMLVCWFTTLVYDNISTNTGLMYMEIYALPREHILTL